MKDVSNIPFAILAGGLATRLQPITNTIPKSLVVVTDKPFLQHQLELLNKHGIKKVVLCVGHLGWMIQEYFGDSFMDIKLSYSYDGVTLLGTGGSIRKALPKLGDTFGVLYGDSYLPIDYIGILKHFIQHNVDGLMTVYNNHNKYDTSNVVFKNNTIILYDKKNKTSDMTHIDYGFSILKSHLFESYSTNTPFDLSDVIIPLTNKKMIIGYEVYERFYEIGSPKGLMELETLFTYNTKPDDAASS